LNSSELRRIFIDYFVERGHEHILSSSLVPGDPTLLFTSAGMVQFKPFFLGEKPPAYTRATSVQKCLRTTDIDSVGKTARHNTFFEMLGNFSFGDYYKESAIPWAWELVTRIFGIDPATLYVSVFEEDEEAEKIWIETGVAPERIVRLGEEDNFWDMGKTGPCGPCSEILFDRGEEFACGMECKPGCDCDRFLELWNLVFMQYERLPGGVLNPLPKKNIDTGMGLERLASLIQGVKTIFETDLFKPIVEAIQEISGVVLGSSERNDISIKVIADHVRAATFLVSDGVIPSNEGRGYVLRRLVRRAVREGRLLEIERPFLNDLAQVVIETMGDVYTELKQHSSLISGVLDTEEEKFAQTLEQGMDILSRVLHELSSKQQKILDGETAFYLHDTLGFPVELTEEIAGEAGLEIDMDGFMELMEKQKTRARSYREYQTEEEAKVYEEILHKYGKTNFEGYRVCEIETRLLAVVAGQKEESEVFGESIEVEVVLESTPFYAESGGQVGDRGVISAPEGNIQVTETYYGAPGLIVHRGILNGRIRQGERVHASIDVERRNDIARNHSATHLLHWALRAVLGSHVKQSGSLVAPERLRFDFTHFKPLTLEEIQQIEYMANDLVLKDVSVSTFETTKDEALSCGALALFGEKYEDYVRVVDIGGISKELCGGTHVERTGQIGQIKIIQESGIGTGLRRIEAISGREMLRRMNLLSSLLGRTSEILKVKEEEVPEKAIELLRKVKELERTTSKVWGKRTADFAKDVIKNSKQIEIGRFKVLFGSIKEHDSKQLRDLADTISNLVSVDLVFLTSVKDEKAQVVIKVSKNLVDKGIDAREIAGYCGRILEGGGGGRPDMAVSGGTNLGCLDKVISDVEVLIRKKIEDLS